MYCIYNMHDSVIHIYTMLNMIFTAHLWLCIDDYISNLQHVSTDHTYGYSSMHCCLTHDIHTLEIYNYTNVYVVFTLAGYV